MLIRIDESIIQFIERDIKSIDEGSDEIIALNNLAQAAREGWHIVIGSLEVLEFLKGLNLLEKNALRLYHTLWSKAAFLPSYEDIFEDYINVRSCEQVFTRHVIAERNIFEIPLNYFSDMYTLLRPSLVSEDLSDCEFYQKLAKKYIKETMRMQNIRINFEPENGGGQNTYQVYEGKLLTKKAVLVIADSDKSYPMDKIGETLSVISKIYNKYKQTHVTDLYALGVREKENLVPPSMYLLCANNSATEYLVKLERLERSQAHGEKLMYLDIKDGLKVKNYRKNDGLKEYVDELFDDHAELVSCSHEEIDLKSDEYILTQGVGFKISNFMEEILDDGLERLLERKKKLPDIPDDIKKQIIDELERKIYVKQHLFENVPDFLKPEWVNLCKKVIAWGCCDHMIAT